MSANINWYENHDVPRQVFDWGQTTLAGGNMPRTFPLVGSIIVTIGYAALALSEPNDDVGADPVVRENSSLVATADTSMPQSVRSFVTSEPSPSIKRSVTMKSGDTLIKVLLDMGVDEQEAIALSSELATVVDPRTLSTGQELTLVTRPEDGQDSVNCIKSLSLSPSQDQLVTVGRDNHGSFSSKIEPLTHDARIVRRSGVIKTSFFDAARAEAVPVPIVLGTYQTFSHVLDFQRQLNPGDRFDIAFTVYDDDGINRQHPGEVIFAGFTVNGDAFSTYRYKTSDGETGYFDHSGKSLATGLMKTPIDNARLSSLYGKREHPVLGYTRMHRGVDFAAETGTPILAAGDGRVVQRGHNGDYGRYVQISHAGDYSTSYAHLSTYLDGLTVGDRVRQGDTIGYVGATGLATGPNLHYKVLLKGRQVDPLAITSPPNRILEGEELERFQSEMTRVVSLLNSSDDGTTKYSKAADSLSKEEGL